MSFVMQWIVRFVVGGIAVSLFATLGDVLKPKGFAGLFGAVPSVAMATLGLTVFTEGNEFASMEARSMIAGAGLSGVRDRLRVSHGSKARQDGVCGVGRALRLGIIGVGAVGRILAVILCS